MESTKSFIAAEHQFRSMSVFSYFTSELTRGYLLEREEEKYAQKRQRVYTFMKTPRELEKFTVYGFFQCLDAFLFLFTFLPLRILLAFIKMFTVPCGFMRSRKFLEPAQICDILKGVILVVCFFILSHIDTSMMYHLVRGQATIKLYVFFNMLDMADRLLSNFGHDILDALFWTATEPRGRRRDHLGTVPHLLIAIVYVILHTMLILFQATVLNVAFNSHNKSLLVIMMSNNFVEIKGSLFRKVDLSHLYQISCSDVKERFHYVVLLSVVCIRNMNEVAWDIEHLWVLLPDALMVLISEVFVDWGKHAFILKFNEIPADAYREFKVKLALDMATSRQRQAFTDHSDLVSRRMGLTPLPLACLLYMILSKSVPLSTYMDYVLLFVLYLCLMSFKVLNSIILLGHSYTIIENYHKQNQPENEQEQEQPDSSREKHSSAAHSSPPFSNHKTHERTSSYDSKVSRNFSQIFSANSFTEITQVDNDSPIEQTGGFTMNASKLAYSEGDIVKQSEECVHDNVLTSHDLDYCSHDPPSDQQNSQNDTSHDSQNSFGDIKITNEESVDTTCDQSEDSQNSSRDFKQPFASLSDSRGAILFHRLHKSLGRKFGSSISLPETIRIPECSETEEYSSIVENLEQSKNEKLE